MFRSFAVVLVATIVSAGRAQTPRYAPGEIMAHFAEGSDGSAAVLQSMRIDPPNLTLLTPVVATLGARVGVPLRATRIGSGNWVTMVIDSVLLADRVERQLLGRESVESITRRQEAPQLLVTLAAGSAEANAAAQATGGANEPLERVLWSLERAVGLPLEVQTVGPDAIALGIDMKALTLAVVARLKALVEIEDAQPNYIVGFR